MSYNLKKLEEELQHARKQYELYQMKLNDYRYDLDDLEKKEYELENGQFDQSGQAARGQAALCPVVRGPVAQNSENSGLYKTKPCKFFAIGKCTKGDSCTFRH